MYTWHLHPRWQWYRACVGWGRFAGVRGGNGVLPVCGFLDAFTMIRNKPDLLPCYFSSLWRTVYQLRDGHSESLELSQHMPKFAIIPATRHVEHELTRNMVLQAFVYWAILTNKQCFNLLKFILKNPIHQFIIRMLNNFDTSKNIAKITNM